jgi:hypothetical protein
MSVKLILSLAAILALMILWPLAAQAGYCPNLPNCVGGDPSTLGACVVGIGMVAGLCAPQNQGGTWVDHSDDFGGDDIGDDEDDILAEDDERSGAGPGPALPPLGGD